MPHPPFSARSLARGVRLALPMAIGVATYGLVFGVLSQQAGMTRFQALFMSTTVFAGASQFVALDIWSWPLPWAALILTTFLVNLRHVLMGTVLAKPFSGLTLGQTYGSLFFLVDENWAFTLSRWQKGDRDQSLLLGTGICLFAAWTLSTLAGVLVSTGLDPVKWGMDFSFTAIFIFLATGLWQGKKDLVPWMVAALVAAAVSFLLPGKWYILAGGLGGSVAGVLIHGR